MSLLGIGSALAAIASAGGLQAVEPPLGGGSGVLEAVSISPADGSVWAVGRSHIDSGLLPVAANWNGAWTEIAAPTGPYEDSWLYDVRALVDGVWVVGVSSTGPLTAIVPIAAFWDGSAWQGAPIPAVGRDSHLWYAIDATSSSDAWAVGEAYDGVGAADQGVAWHWDGAAWTASDVPPVGDARRLLDVAAIAPDDVWAVGTAFNGSEGFPMVIHWDGAAWTSFPVSGISEISAISASGPDDVWAVGLRAIQMTHSIRWAAQSIHWDGTAWTAIAMAQPGTKINLPNEVVAVSPTEAWAVGRWDPSDGTTAQASTLVEHWDGTSWKMIASANVDPLSNELLGVDATGGRDVVAVGTFGNGGDSRIQPLVLAP